MNSRTLLIIVAIVVLLLIAFFVFAGNEAGDQSSTATTTPQATTTAPVATTSESTAPTSGGQTNNRVTITYGANGFSPATITVAPGTTVTWVNQGSGRMWVGSDEHPTHTNYDGSSTAEHCANGAPTSASTFDQCGAGTSYSFTFTKAGTWDYHNHANSSHGGSVVVR